MDEKRKFGELELKVMNILWQKKSATVLDVQKVLGSGTAYTTVMTVLSRMFQKNLISRSKAGKNYIYTCNEDKSSGIGGILDKIKNSIFGGNSIQMVNYLIENTEGIRPEDLELISDLIEAKKKEIGERNERK